VKAGRKTVRDGIASVVDLDLLSSSISLRKQRKSLLRLLRQQVNPDNLTAALSQMEPRHEIAIRRNRVVDGWVTLSFDWRLGVTFQIADKTMNDHT
jgi:hypothetical protein